MDKSTLLLRDPSGLEVHREDRGKQQIHDDYGLWVCRCGAGSRSPAQTVKARYFEFYAISHLLEGQGCFWTEDSQTVYEPGQAVIVTPGLIHCYGGYKDHYVEDTVCFKGPIADRLHRSGVLKGGIFKVGKNRRLLPIINYAVDPTPDSQMQANMALQNLLMDFYLESKHSQSPSQIEALITQIQTDNRKWWTVREMAEFCSLSEVQFRRVFKRETGFAPKSYLDQVKIRNAAQRLMSSAYTVAEIAEELGYVDPFHFSRRFKEITGHSPLQYRKLVLRR